MINFLIPIIALLFLSIDTYPKKVVQNGMTVSWFFQTERIHFTLEAPTEGWVAIGFNTSTDLTGAFLLMARISNSKAEAIEHWIFHPGDYRSYESLGLKSQIEDISGKIQRGQSTISFSLPISPQQAWARPLKPGLAYVMLMAYSQELDFQHHSRMRTSLKVQL